MGWEPVDTCENRLPTWCAAVDSISGRSDSPEVYVPGTALCWRPPSVISGTVFTVRGDLVWVLSHVVTQFVTKC